MKKIFNRKAISFLKKKDFIIPYRQIFYPKTIFLEIRPGVVIFSFVN